MRKFTKAVVPAVIALSAVCLFGGCAGKTTETTAAETSAAAETEAAATAEDTMGPDAKAIAAIDPKKPENMGTVKIGDLSTIKIKAPLAQKVTEEDIDTYITDYILDSQSVEVDGAIENGYTANIDFVGKINGEAFEGGTAQGYELGIGSKSFIEGFEEGLIGAKAGDKVSLNLRFPDDYTAEFAGKDVVFDVTVNSVSRPMTLADFTDENAKTFSSGNYTTVEDYRAGVREALEQTAEALVKGELFTKAVEEAYAVSEAEVNDDVTQWLIDMYIQNYDKTLLTNYGYRLADMLSMYSMAYDDYRNQISTGAEDTAKQTAVIYAIADEQGFEYNDESLQKYLDEYGYTKELVTGSTTEEWLKNTVIQYLVSKYVIEQAEVEFLPFEEYQALLTAEAEAAAAEAVEEELASAEAETEAETK